MDRYDIYQQIAERTNGDIYIGVVGPVRTGKSTFIKRFMDLLVIPNIENSFERDRARDELPQSAAGRTIMTTEPKFVPNEAVKIVVGDNIQLSVRLVDCVGYLVKNALGQLENDAPRMVDTPWYDHQIPFNEAAELGTRKVIKEHSTIGLVVTTDGSITEIGREEYVDAEEKVVSEMMSTGKPFAILLNCADPTSDETTILKNVMEEKYGVPVMPINCARMEQSDIYDIMKTILYEFPVCEIGINVPGWLESLEEDDPLKASLYKAVRESFVDADKLRTVTYCTGRLKDNNFVKL
ncbi:MAG: stage IV sporulation protein A, partial [Clostridiales bacterium]|nr:stage IV sporulation protein A [Clostridiales bacterium]